MMLEKDPLNFSTMQTKMPKGGMRSRLCGIKIHHRLFSIVNILCNVKHAHCRLSKCNGTLVSPCSIPPDTQCGIHQDSCSVNRLCCVVSRIAFSMDVPFLLLSAILKTAPPALRTFRRRWVAQQLNTDGDIPAKSPSIFEKKKIGLISQQHVCHPRGQAIEQTMNTPARRSLAT